MSRTKRNKIITTTWVAAFGQPARSRFVMVIGDKLMVWSDGKNGYTDQHGIKAKQAKEIVASVRRCWEIGDQFGSLE